VAKIIQEAVNAQGASASSDIEAAVAAALAGQEGLTRADVEAIVNNATAGGLSAADVQRIVDQSIQNIPVPQIDTGQLSALVQSAVAASAPEGIDVSEINRMVQAAVTAAQAGAVTRGDLEALVTKSIQDAAADQLSAEQVQEIVAASLQATNKAIEEAAMATEELRGGQLTAADVQNIVDASIMQPEVCRNKGYEVTDCPPTSPHNWKPAKQQVPGEVWVFQDYDGPKPTQFFESPYSYQLVQEGKIPPLMERLPVPEDVEVLAGPDGIGVYGGYYRQIQTHNYIGEWITASWNRRDSLGGLKWFPWVGKGWEVSEDGRVWTFTNRRGLKWSDGHPLDMESVEFAWELNLTPALFGATFPLWASSPVTQNPPKFNVVDDVTWTLTYDDPIFTIMESRATPSALCGPRRVCIVSHPKMQKYYPQYAGQAAIDKLIKDEGHADLIALLNDRWHVYTNITEIPCAAPFCALSDSEALTEWEKNQYHWFVDPEGNQIPYMDGAVMPKLENRDVIIFRAMAGEEDGRTSTFIPGELPLYVSNMVKGDFSIFHWPSSGGADLSATMQQTYNEDPRIGELIRTQDFRIALSHTVDKEVLNDLVLSGVGVVQNRVPRPNNPYYPGDEYRMLHMQQDLDKANAMLDAIGLANRDPDGFRMHKDGSGTVEMQITVGPSPNPAVSQAAEILKAAWQEAGIKTNIAAVRQTTRDSLQTSGIARDYSAYQYNPWMVQWTSLAPLTRGDLAGEIGKWYASKGQEGMAPTGGDPAWLPLAGADEFPADAGGKLMRQSQLWVDGLGYNNLDPKRVEAGKEMFATNADQLWALNCCAYSGVFRGIYISRNNFRNKPITHERDHNGFSAWARFFEDGVDNYHNPGNRSNYCASWAFIQGGSPYDRCTKNAW
jgi:peptide/nickel transport system substrate-binding protein